MNALPAPTFEVFSTFYYREAERLIFDRARYTSPLENVPLPPKRIRDIVSAIQRKEAGNTLVAGLFERTVFGAMTLQDVET